MIARLEVPEHLAYETMKSIIEPVGGRVIYSYTLDRAKHRVIRFEVDIEPCQVGDRDEQEGNG